MKKCIPVLLMLTILICGCSKQAQESTSEPVSDTF
jgi:thiamine biosynthesis lipoprotein